MFYFTCDRSFSANDDSLIRRVCWHPAAAAVTGASQRPCRVPCQDDGSVPAARRCESLSVVAGALYVAV